MKQQYRSYDDAKKFLRPLKLKNYNEWVEYCKSGNKPEDVPENPWDVYEKEWFGSMTFLDAYSSPCVDNGYRTHGEAMTFVRKLNLKNSIDWSEYCKSDNKPDAIPNLPEIIYEKEGWFGWDYWLGIGKASYRSFNDARKFIRSLNLKNSRE